MLLVEAGLLRPPSSHIPCTSELIILSISSNTTLSSLCVMLTLLLQNWFKRITVHAMDGCYIKANDGKETTINLTPRTIAGPLCYATDIVSKVGILYAC